MTDKEIREALFDKFERIQALCQNPHWTPDRRWRISELAGEGQALLQQQAQMERKS